MPGGNFIWYRGSIDVTEASGIRCQRGSISPRIHTNTTWQTNLRKLVKPSIMRETLNRLINHEILSKEDAQQILVNMAKGAYNTSQIAAFLTVYKKLTPKVELCLATPPIITYAVISRGNWWDGRFLKWWLLNAKKKNSKPILSIF